MRRLPLLLLGALALPAAAQPAAEVAERIERALVPAVVIENEPSTPVGIEERMVRLGVPGVGIAYFADGEIVWTRSYGLADVESGAAVTPETRFQAASISKPVAATAALDLVEAGLLSLDGDVNDVLTTWQVPPSPLTADAPVTLRGLLTHTAGLTVHGFPGYGPGERVPTTAGVLRGDGNTDPVGVDLVPRTENRYSGGGYTVAQLLVEDATGRPFADVLRDHVLGPLGMEHSTFAQPVPEALHAVAATGYRGDGVPVGGRFHTYPEQAAAGLWTTPSDLARWALAIQRSLGGEGHPVLDAETVRQMVTPDSVGGHGLGPGLFGNGAFFGHGGANEGFRCVLTAAADGSAGIVVMTNSDAGGALGDEVMMTVAEVLGWEGPTPMRKVVVALSPETLGGRAGRYRSVERPAMTVALRAEGSGLVATLEWSGHEVRLAPESEAAFFDRADGTPVVFEDVPGTGFTVDGLTFQRIEE